MISLARKYRPKTLDDLLGQDALVRMVRTAIDTDRIAQAYILTGVRGVGKTTTARIIARSLNCEHGPTLTPCGSCAACREIDADSSLDVIELDAASRNGVAEIRDLLESMPYAPMRRGARKIYIIDEAHMLSTPAWNALLKTLEEPPAHVIFIFATTEHRKIPATIQSRCQRFSLRRIEADVIEKNVETIAASEGARLEPGVSRAIARAGEGSMRDAISILDQAISGSSGTIGLDATLAMLGRGSRQDLFRLFAAIADGEVRDAVTLWRAAIAAGADPIAALDDLLEIAHMATLTMIDPDLLDLVGATPSEQSALQSLRKSASYGELVGVEKMLFDNRKQASDAANRISGVELLVIRAAAGFAKLRKAKKTAA